MVYDFAHPRDHLQQLATRLCIVAITTRIPISTILKDSLAVAHVELVQFKLAIRQGAEDDVFFTFRQGTLKAQLVLHTSQDVAQD